MLPIFYIKLFFEVKKVINPTIAEMVIKTEHMMLMIEITLVVLLTEVTSIRMERLLYRRVRIEIINPNGTTNEMIEKTRANMSLFFFVVGMVSSRLIH